MTQSSPGGLSGWPAHNGRQFMAPKEAAARIGVHVQTIYRWMKRTDKRRRPPVRRYGPRCLRIPIDEFMRWNADNN